MLLTHFLPKSHPNPACRGRYCSPRALGFPSSLNLTSDFMESISCASSFHFPSPLFDCKLLEGRAEFFLLLDPTLEPSALKHRNLIKNKNKNKIKNKISVVEKLSKFTFSVFSFSLVS